MARRRPSNQFEVLVIFLNKGFRKSISYQLLMYFLVTGTILFGALVSFFIIISEDFSDIVIEKSLHGLSEDMKESFYLSPDGTVMLDDSEIMLKWGFDALYSNLGYRLIHIETDQEVIRSVPEGIEGALIDAIPHDIASGFSTDGTLERYRVNVNLAGNKYHLDVVRSDLLGKLANEAVLPAIIDVSLFAMIIAFLLFVMVNIVAIRLIVKPVKGLSKQVEKIQPDDLTQRISLDHVPTELVPVAQALNDALNRVEIGFESQKSFVANAAHELRTPLTVLLSRLQLSMEDSDLKSSFLKDTKYISRIVEQLLDLSRAQNTAKQSKDRVDLVTVVKDVMSVLAPLTLETNHSLELVADVESAMLNIDQGELSVVIKNLVENAIKYTPGNSDIRVTVGKCNIIIEDSGPGIPEDMHEKVFERFYRLNQSDLSGSGLGLAIVKEILSHYSASISISTSTQLGGARFEITFDTEV